ncbi:MAG: hypothetical protein MUE86_02495 [Thiobacillaceae bacterium]|nr:hypothetical protein [Thiobacillaceae bacterium]
MYPSYYALRRVNPYRGVVQHVDVGGAIASSHDGLVWHLRADDGYGLVRPVGVWEEGRGMKIGQPRGLEDLLAALESRPALPFPIFDIWELWLLDREEGMPLALLSTARGAPRGGAGIETEWLPFTLTYTGFRAAALAERDVVAPDAGGGHRDMLAKMVNHTARPFAMAQWFRRGQDGVGHGAAGLRLPHEWRSRAVAAEAFPELLVREKWNSRLEQSVINDYHRWLAPLLLLWPRLSEATRRRLELQACEKPRWLARVRYLLPPALEAERIQAALVAARMEEALAGGDAYQDELV